MLVGRTAAQPQEEKKGAPREGKSLPALRAAEPRENSKQYRCACLNRRYATREDWRGLAVRGLKRPGYSHIVAMRREDTVASIVAMRREDTAASIVAMRREDTVASIVALRRAKS